MLEPIGRVRSPYREKFGVPRQPGLAPSVQATIELDGGRIDPQALRGLEGVSHLWVLFVFHGVETASVATVRPPRLGGNRRLGVLATRSPFRPNPIGLSAVKLLSVEGLALRVAGGDFLDETPVLDLKPYLPYADAIPEARCDWATAAPESLDIEFSRTARDTLAERPDRDSLRRLIVESLRWDPRPAYRRRDVDEREYGVRLADSDVRWRVDGNTLMVTEIRPAP